MSGFRVESDTMGQIKVPDDRYWGAQTQRAIKNFPIGVEKFPREFIRALGIVKRACAEINKDLGKLPQQLTKVIVKASQEVIEGKLDDHFPLVIWQSGSGTQTNMNVNEVISNRANKMLGEELGKKSPVHPNDHVNLSQSSNDVIPTAMHISTVDRIVSNLLPSLQQLLKTLEAKQEEFGDIVKSGRTHLQDAAPLTLGQEFSGYATQIRHGINRIQNSLVFLYELALGGTAVGTGLNSHPEFAERVAKRIAELTGFPFRTSENKFEGLASHDALVEASGTVKVVAVSLMKIANDMRLLGSGPRCGIGELILPENEPGSSIMPGKVNPTQIESVTQVVAQVLGNDTTISFAGTQGNLELNVFKPVIIYNLLQSIRLVTDVTRSFRERCLRGLQANREKIDSYLEKNLSFVTVLSPIIGYDQAAKVAKEALESGKTLKQVVLDNQLLSAAQVEIILDPSKMISP